MRLHPLHPLSVHAPIACIAFTPLADLGALLSHRSCLWAAGALMAGGAAIFGLAAASIGALDFERAYPKAPKAVSWHAGLMASAVTLDGVSALGRFGRAFSMSAAPAWAITTSMLALIAAIVGGYLGGDLVYRHGVNVEGRPRDLTSDSK